jgi:hypothetical protein
MVCESYLANKCYFFAKKHDFHAEKHDFPTKKHDFPYSNHLSRRLAAQSPPERSGPASRRDPEQANSSS